MLPLSCGSRVQQSVLVSSVLHTVLGCSAHGPLGAGSINREPLATEDKHHVKDTKDLKLQKWRSAEDESLTSRFNLSMPHPDCKCPGGEQNNSIYCPQWTCYSVYLQKQITKAYGFLYIEFYCSPWFTKSRISLCKLTVYRCNRLLCLHTDYLLSIK